MISFACPTIKVLLLPCVSREVCLCLSQPVQVLSHSLAQIMVQGSSGLHGCLFVPSSISIKSFPVTARTHAAEAMSSMQGTSAEPIMITLPKLQGQQLLPFIWLEVSEKAMGSLMLSSRARRSRQQQ